MIKKILIGLGVVILLIIVAIVVVPMLIPLDAYKQQLVARIQQATGRQAKIAGEFNFSIFPNVEFTAGKVSLANASGHQPAQMIEIGKLYVRVVPWPLLSGHVQVESLALDKPVIALSVDKAGRPNWQFGAGGGHPAAAVSRPGAGGGGFVKGVSLGDVRIVGGRILYADARTGRHYEADKVDLKLSLPALSQPFIADGSLVWRKEKVALHLRLARPDRLLAGEPTPVEARLAAPALKASFRGTLAHKKAIAAQGALALESPSLRRLIAWAGSPLAAPGSGFGRFKLTGTAALAGADLTLKKAEIALDAIKATGDLRIDAARSRPYVEAKLSLDRLDLNPYLPSPAKDPPGAAATHGWSTAPLDFAALRRADANLDLRLGALAVRRIKIGHSHLLVTLKGGRLVLDLRQMALYGGNGKAKLTLDGSGGTPAIAFNADLSGLKLNPFLADTIGSSRLEGTANGSATASGHGGSQRAIVSTLAGSGKFKFRDGAIRGINLAAMVRNVKGAFRNAQALRQQKTDFTEISGSYTIKNGVLANKDLDFKSPLLRVTGRGTVNLVARTVDYRVEPKLVASLAGQGGKSGLAGIMVPVIVTGPWDDLHYRPDLAAAIGQATKGKGLQELQKAIPGGGKIPLPKELGGAQPQQPEKPGDALKQLFH